jgi:hypothetical protein
MSTNFVDLLLFKGGKIEDDVALRGIDIKTALYKVTTRPFTIIFYHDIPEKLIDGINVILFIYPNSDIGHWCFIDINKTRKKMYFFDPYGNVPDGQWPYLANPANMPVPEFKLSEYIKDAVEKQGYKFHRNAFNIQGSIRNGHIVDSSCGELVIFRIINKEMNDEDFYDLCRRLGGKKIFDIVNKLL